MTHLKGKTTAQKKFIISKVRRAKPKQVYKIYRATEKAIHHKKRR